MIPTSVSVSVYTDGSTVFTVCRNSRQWDESRVGSYETENVHHRRSWKVPGERNVIFPHLTRDVDCSLKQQN
jgi:hypothetical protein